MRKIASLFLAVGWLCHAGGFKQKLSTDLRSASHNGPLQVIVQWEIGVGASTTDIITGLGGTVLTEFAAVHSGLYTIPPGALDFLAKNPAVKYVSLDRKVQKKTVGISTSAIGFTPAAVNAPAVWAAGYRGSGIGVAIVDSGINQDGDLGMLQKPVYSEDFTGAATSGPKSPGYGLDWYGHGQHIAGIIASNGKSSICSSCTQTFYGIAPGANLINLKVLDASGQGTDSSVIAAVNRAIMLKSTYNIRVMNLSLGRSVYESYTEDPLCQAVEAAWKSGITVVVAAGNDGRDDSLGNQGYGTINAPGNDPYVITVGAMKSMGTPGRSDDLVASYSSKGPTAIDHVVKPDIMAPGNMIVSLMNKHATLTLKTPENFLALAAYQKNAPRTGSIPDQPPYDPSTNKQPPAAAVGAGYSDQYFVLSGTSMATGVVSGAIADLLQAVPSLTPDQVKLLLMQTSSKTFPTSSTVIDSTTGQSYTSYYDIFTIGAGYLDMQAALNAIQSIPSGANSLSPIASYDPNTGDVELSFDPSSIFANRAMWGAGGMWGTSGVWSDSVLSGTRAMWGASAVWGAASDVNPNKAMWGASALWGNRAMWGASSQSASESDTAAGEQ